MRQNIIKLARADYAENKKLFFMSIAFAILIAFGFFYWLWNNFNLDVLSNHNNIDKDVFLEEMKSNRFSFITSTLSTIFFVVVMYIFSKSFGHYFNKKYAVQAVMLPASRKEKFCYIILRNVVLIPLILMIICCINNTLWSYFLGIDYTFMNYKLSVWGVNILLFQGIFLTTFIFSSIYFKRHQFVFGWLILIIGWMIHIVICGSLQPYDKSIITSIVMSLFILGILYSVWWKYKNLQI